MRVSRVGIPTLLSPFTLTLTLSHQGRGDLAAALPHPMHPLRSLRSASPYASRRGRYAAGIPGEPPLNLPLKGEVKGWAPLRFSKGASS